MIVFQFKGIAFISYVQEKYKLFASLNSVFNTFQRYFFIYSIILPMFCISGDFSSDVLTHSVRNLKKDKMATWTEVEK